MLLKSNKGFLVISKNKPPVAGSIAWARSIFYRVKRPIMKFQKKEDELDPESYNAVKTEYKNLAKSIDEY